MTSARAFTSPLEREIFALPPPTAVNKPFSIVATSVLSDSQTRADKVASRGSTVKLNWCVSPFLRSRVVSPFLKAISVAGIM